MSAMDLRGLATWRILVSLHHLRKAGQPEKSGMDAA